jgi:hypothetical protein
MTLSSVHHSRLGAMRYITSIYRHVAVPPAYGVAQSRCQPGARAVRPGTRPAQPLCPALLCSASTACPRTQRAATGVHGVRGRRARWRRRLGFGRSTMSLCANFVHPLYTSFAETFDTSFLKRHRDRCLPPSRRGGPRHGGHPRRLAAGGRHGRSSRSTFYPDILVRFL